MKKHSKTILLTVMLQATFIFCGETAELPQDSIAEIVERAAKILKEAEEMSLNTPEGEKQQFDTDNDDNVLRKEVPKGVRFEVDNVKIAEDYLGEVEIEEIQNDLERGTYFIPQEHRTEQLVYTRHCNLPNAVMQAYKDHRPLALSPDEIWLTICQGMSIHINENFKRLKHKIYKGKVSQQLTVENNKLGLYDPAWQELVDSMATKTSNYTGPLFYDAFVPQFSTTTPTIKTAYQITLLGAQQKAFDYVAITACGIPYITLLGTTEDWKLIKTKLSILDQLGMKKWKASLEPIIDQFISASEGKVDADFWQNIYKDKRDEYDAYAISGWIHKLYPYIIDIYYKKNLEQRYKPNPFLDKKLKSGDYLTSNRFPNGTTKVPITWKNLRENETKELWFVSGFMGLKQYKDKTLEPFISWAIYTEYPE